MPRRIDNPGGGRACAEGRPSPKHVVWREMLKLSGRLLGEFFKLVGQGDLGDSIHVAQRSCLPTARGLACAALRVDVWRVPVATLGVRP
jgi:hypothetical protein